CARYEGSIYYYFDYW
nr:immunoglobulin heavy chain junction region [Macaca mulatta]MOV38735.1 immunoglobulin heavy chain junction region [Macaca mulatta]MOV39427.1 immunoglobulin heavy chain junction region [Macaca mulatta]MOV39571.1 immunoglobulin heavy chain junction region [Macaca mulatta]MOV40211.1 immunoglobulin heavy chain junction region [Macaca mulatta]